MHSGRLRHRIAIQSKVETQDSMGGVIETWTTIATRWGSIEPLQPRELFQAQQVDARISHRIGLRYYPGLTSEHRLVYDNRIFEILSPLNQGERDRMTDVLAMEQTP